MSLYETFKLIHVLGAMVWVGGGVFQIFAAGRMMGVDDAAALPWARTMHAAGNNFFSRAAMTTLAAGIAMVFASSSIGFLDAWIVIGLVGLATSIGIGAGLIGATTTMLVAALEPQTHDHASVAPLTNRLRRLALLDLTVQVIVVFAMVTKPGG